MHLIWSSLAALLILMVTCQAAPDVYEVSLYNKDKEAELCIDLNQRTRTRQLAGGTPDFQPVKTTHGIIYWNPKVHAYATTWYSEILLKVRILSQLLTFFRDSALSRGEAIDGAIPLIAFAQREKLITPELANKYTQQSGDLQMYYNQNKASFDSLAHPMPWHSLDR